MKRIVFYLILFFLGDLTLLAQSSTAQRKEVLVKAIQALKSEDKEAFLACGLSKPAFKNYLLTLKNIKIVSPEHERGIDSIIDESYPEYMTMLADNYGTIVRKTSQLKWNTLLLDSVQFSKEKGKTNSGCIFLHYADNSAFYKMNFEELLLSEGLYYLQSLYVPYVDVGPRNRLLTKDLKNRFIDSCIVFNKRQAAMAKDKNMQEIIVGKCPRCRCENQYVSETDQRDGVARVKRYLEFSRPAKKK